MTLSLGPALVVVGVVITMVTAWGIWLSRGSSENGPDWALSVLSRWRPMPWLLAGVGAALIVATRSPWIGSAILYVGAVTGWLMWRTRRTLESVKRQYGFD